jgi:SAM-dependent methyltransferase
MIVREPDEASASLPAEYLRKLLALEKAYLAHDDPVRQSGFSGGAKRWKKERGIILDAVAKDGSFLDIGCANGYLLECLVEWAKQKGVTLTPYGVDLGARLVELAKRRFPQYASHFWVANAWDWRPPRKFSYVYALHDCVPEGYLIPWVRRLLAHCVEPGGTLIVGAYGSYSENSPARDVARELTARGFSVSGSAAVGELPVSAIAWIKQGN